MGRSTSEKRENAEGGKGEVITAVRIDSFKPAEDRVSEDG